MNGIGKVPDNDHDDARWLRAKLYTAIQHLRDVEDFYRLRGGLATGFNMVRADRARQLYELIDADFLNGKITVPTTVDRLRAALADAVWAADYLAEQQAMVDEGFRERLEAARAEMS